MSLVVDHVTKRFVVGRNKPTVTAVDDDMWKTAVNQTMWQNARYLTWNDQGSGALKVTSVAAKSAAGGNLTFGRDGTSKFTPQDGSITVTTSGHRTSVASLTEIMTPGYRAACSAETAARSRSRCTRRPLPRSAWP